ncbi:ABC transporter substrate-binding protein [Candidatus Babeliales bacterium]|nr:ABC transporter substrate-binding protein [Candidatus Babeliales bacterium]
MNIRKMTVVITGTLALCALVIALKSMRHKTKHHFTIGIIQTASHPALDAVREGFKQQALKTLGDVAFVEQNAQGSTSTAHLIAQSFNQNNAINLVLAIATPAAQAMAAINTQLPVIFAAVTDPHAAGLCGTEQKNICGVTDSIDVAQQCALVHQLAPGAQKVALIFNKGEINATSMVAKMEHELAKLGLTPIMCCVTNESEIPAATASACSKADVLLAPIDNTVASTIDFIAQMARTKKIPLFVSDNLLVKRGALAARGVDYHTSGITAGDLAHKILVEHQKPSQTSAITPACKTIFINKNTAQACAITIPQELSNNAQIIEVCDE